MEQLPGGDAIFLSMETPTSPGHVGGLTLLNPSESPDFGFEKVVSVIDERIRFEPRYTKKLREVTLGLDRPYLVDDPHFDIRNHVRRIAVPAPGGMREIADLIGYLFSRPLDRDKPLWEMWFIEGVAKKRAAMFMKSHHCLMDGMSGAGLGELLCDLEPNPENGPILAPKPRSVQTEDLTDLGVALRAAGNLVRAPARMARFTGNILRQTAVGFAASLRDKEAPPLPTDVPTLGFNAPVGPRRAFACSTVSLDDVKAVKKHFDVTVNDVVLAITGSALRGYLEKRGELPERPLVAAIALSTRKEGDDSVGNQVSMVPVSWATDLADPTARLLQIHRNAGKAKEFAEDHDADMLAGMGEALPPGFMGLFMRTLGPSMAAAANPANVIVSNVRGTPVPLYTAGAKIESMYPMSVLAPGQGLNVTVVSYDGRIDVGFTADPDLVPDLWDLAEAIPAALEELLFASGRRKRSARGARRSDAARVEAVEAA